MPTPPQAVRTVFVIMPFVRVEGGARDEARLASFFENHIKRPRLLLVPHASKPLESLNLISIPTLNPRNRALTRAAHDF